MIVVEKRQDISVLKTIGATDGAVMRIFHVQGFLLGAVGTLLGVSLGVLLCACIGRFGVPINPEVHYIDRLPVKMEPVEIGLVAVSSLVMSLLITLYPAKMASRVTVIEGLRSR
jgi:lipoprotein-releasing system permease protein